MIGTRIVSYRDRSWHDRSDQEIETRLLVRLRKALITDVTTEYVIMDQYMYEELREEDA